MAGKRTTKSRSGSSGKSAKAHSAESATQTWRQPPPTPRSKMVRKQTRTTRVVRPGVSPVKGWLQRIRWAQVGVFTLLIATAAGIAYGITLEPFQVTRESIEVIGAGRLEAWEVVEAAEVAGQNAFTVQADPAVDRILALPGVKSAGVRVRLPNRVIIELAEFMPLVEWQRPDGRRWLAEDGSLVPISGDAPGLILVDPLGEAADAEGSLRKNILESLAIIRQARPDQHEFYYGIREGIYFRAPEGWNVYLGEEGRMARKLEILAGLQDTLAAREPKPKKVDLRFEEFPTLE